MVRSAVYRFDAQNFPIPSEVQYCHFCQYLLDMYKFSLDCAGYSCVTYYYKSWIYCALENP